MDPQWRTHDLTVNSNLTSDALIDREWLITNGTGAFAMGTTAGCNTRRYHGLLVASTHPPVGRVVVLNQMLERLEWEHEGKKQQIEWSACAFRDPKGAVVVSPQGNQMVRRFEKGLSVRWTCRSEGLPGGAMCRVDP